MQYFINLAVLLTLTWYTGTAQAQASIAEEVSEIKRHVETSVPMPIGAAIEKLETWLLSEALTQNEKREVAALYVQYQLLIHQRPEAAILNVLEALQDNSRNGLFVAVGIARIYGISADYELAQTRFNSILTTPNISAEIRAYALIYQVLTHS